jgi:hypothetical protein
MITKTAKATSAHQATLSVSFCHFRTSHIPRTLVRALRRSRRAKRGAYRL